MATKKKTPRRGRVRRRPVKAKPSPGRDAAEAWRPLPGEHPQGLERQVRGSRAGTGPQHLPMASPEHVARAAAEGEDAVNLLVRETKRAQVEASRRDPRAFIEYAFGIQQQWFHDEWQTLLDSAPDALIIAPRGHGKTTQIIGRLLWEFGKNPNLRVKLVCASDSKANERVQEIREHIQRNPRVAEVFPHLEPADDRDWTKRKLTLRRTIISRDVSLEALGIGSSVTGGRADMLIFDDICDERNTLRFPELREQIKRTFKAAFAPVLEPTGRTWYVCTLYHEADNSHELVRAGRYDCACHRDPDDDGEPRTWRIVRHDVGVPGDTLRPLWPRVWNRERLAARRLKIGSVEFDRAYRNMPQSESTQIIQAGWIVYDEPPPREDLVTFQAYDLADGENKKGDAFAGVTIGTPIEWPPGPEMARWQEALDALSGNVAAVEALDWGPRPIWVLSAFAERIPFGDQVRRIISEWVEWQATYIGIEKVTCEGVSAQLQREPGAPILPVFRLRPVKSKARRLNGVSPLVQSGRVRFAPHLDPDRNPGLVHAGDVVSELRQFPIAKHDDLVDAFVYALLLLMRWEAVSRSERDEADDGVGVRVFGAPRVTGSTIGGA